MQYFSVSPRGIRRAVLHIGVLGLLITSVWTLGIAETGTPPATSPNALAPELLSEETQLVALVDRALPSVVSIVGTEVSSQGTTTVVGRGTGFIVEKNGIIVTNKHVVGIEDATYRVYLADGRRFVATVASRDPLKDIAIMKVAAENLPTIPLGNSDAIKVGQTAIAIGNSLGRYPNSVTRGIVSGVGRSLTASDDRTGQQENLDGVIQTDAEINPGNSGGPLLNAKGEVIGMNTAIESTGRGLGFSIPVNDVKKSVESYKKNGRIVRPYLGLRYITITADLQDERKLAYDYGALVTAGALATGPTIVPGSPADKAGIREGDIILSVNDILVRGDHSLVSIIQAKNVGDTVQLKINRKGTLIFLSLTLVEVPTASR